ncbi:MAG: Antifreeze glycoprotein/trypsinogen-like protein protease chimeric [Candidatus Nomurabacteria bacterium GW2011_GWF2_40_31]|nr:MAG: Antifreeze glycoprotein/trypsinogen-like protein protease chimeric [Candidatus Nomurabacteria bacterium GW2011_GWF2_40_31]
MIKKLKIGLVATGLSIALGAVPVIALAADVNFDVITNIVIGTRTYNIAAGSAATTLVLATDGLSLAVEVPTSSNFILVSADRSTLTTTGGTVACTNSESTLTIAGLTGTTRTITPSTTACGAITGGGTPAPAASTGGGAPAAAAIITPVVVTPVVTVDTGCVAGAKFSITTGKACAAATVTPATPATPAVPGVSPAIPATPATVYNFGTTTLELQRFLNDKLNLGLVLDGKLGPKTIAVIKTWQADNGLVPDGLIGAKTKAMMNAGATPATPASTSQSTGSYNFGTTTLKNGSKNCKDS